MKSNGIFPLVVLLALGTLAPWTVEGVEKMPSKAGRCPPRTPAMCLRYEPPECKSDWQCPGKKKCCPDICGIKCLDPTAILVPDNKKPGKCPVVCGQCMMLNPSNYCEKDGECKGDLKCCKSMCGKVCMAPVKA
ncbi:antileukoproteinase [Trichechus manatus latirostris]|uniref:Antileukoproteinase n=1 Tax=Trichechus manatus latirostris TaxID=127582 RepID=A0A2Y9DAT6_TRIMA|nr:antileukoproteinase [Trichechus manatus latirostris]